MNNNLYNDINEVRRLLKTIEIKAFTEKNPNIELMDELENAMEHLFKIETKVRQIELVVFKVEGVVEEGI